MFIKRLFWFSVEPYIAKLTANMMRPPVFIQSLLWPMIPRFELKHRIGSQVMMAFEFTNRAYEMVRWSLKVPIVGILIRELLLTHSAPRGIFPIVLGLAVLVKFICRPGTVMVTVTTLQFRAIVNGVRCLPCHVGWIRENDQLRYIFACRICCWLLSSKVKRSRSFSCNGCRGCCCDRSCRSCRSPSS